MHGDNSQTPAEGGPEAVPIAESGADDPSQIPGLLADREAHLQPLDPAASAALFEALAAETVDKPATRLESLRALRTPQRVMGAMLGVLGALGMSIAMGVRPDMVTADSARVGVLLLVLVAVSAIVITVALRGYHRRPMGARSWAVIGISLGIPTVLAIFPDLWATGPGVTAAGAERCFAFGSLNAFAVAAVVWLFQRGSRPAGWRLGAAACAGGLAGFASLQLHCPSRDVSHLLIGHAAVGIFLTGVALAYAGNHRRSQSSA